MNISLSSQINLHNNRITKKNFALITFSMVILTVATLVLHDNLAFCYVATSMYLILYILSGKEYSLAFVLFGISNSKLLNIGGASASVIVCVIFVILGFFHRKRVKIGIIVSSAIYFFYCSQYFIRFADYSSSIIMPIKYIFVILYFYLFVNDVDLVKNRLDILKKSVIICSIGIVVNVFVSYFINGRSARLAVVDNDPNMLAVESAVMLTFLFILYLRQRKIPFGLFMFLALSMAAVIILSGSRSGLLLLALSIIVSLLLNIRKVYKIIPLLIVSLAFALLFFRSSFGQNIIENLVNRTKVQINNTGSFFGSRIGIWKLYVDKLNESSINWLFGFGTQTNVGIEDMAHNFFLESVAGNGIVGVSLMLIPIVQIVKSFSKRIGKISLSIFDFSPILIIIIGGITLHSLFSVINLSMMFGSLLLAKEKQIIKHSYDD